MEWEKRQKFSIRKFTIGAASVMIGQFYLGTVTNAPSVSADERSRADVEVVTLPQDEQLNHVTLPAEKTAEQAPATTQETSVEEKTEEAVSSTETVVSETPVQASKAEETSVQASATAEVVENQTTTEQSNHAPAETAKSEETATSDQAKEEAQSTTQTLSQMAKEVAAKLPEANAASTENKQDDKETSSQQEGSVAGAYEDTSAASNQGKVRTKRSKEGDKGDSSGGAGGNGNAGGKEGGKDDARGKENQKDASRPGPNYSGNDHGDNANRSVGKSVGIIDIEGEVGTPITTTYVFSKLTPEVFQSDFGTTLAYYGLRVENNQLVGTPTKPGMFTLAGELSGVNYRRKAGVMPPRWEKRLAYCSGSYQR